MLFLLRSLLGIVTLAASFSTSTLWAQTRVKAEELSRLTIAVNRSVPAQVISLREATIASELTANVIELPIMVGDQLDPGQNIGKLECADNELNLKQAQAELSALAANRTLAKQQLERLQKLQLNRNASEEQINQRQAELSVVNARINAQSITIRIAKRQVEKCEISSPFRGVVTQVRSEIGNFTTPGTPIFSLVDIENIELDAALTSIQLTQVNKTNQLFFLFEEQTYPVKVRTILPVVDLRAQTRKARLTFSEHQPLPGANGRLQWVLTGNIVPASLIVNRNNRNGVFIIDSTQPDQPIARFIAVQNIQQGQPASVDIEDSTLIVTDGRFSLVDGEKVVLE